MASPAAADGQLRINLEALETETRCIICMGIIKGAGMVSCMHRYCSDCIATWLRTTKDKSCPQCKKALQSRRDAKKDARFDRLLRVLYGDIERFEEEVYEPNQEVLAEAKATGAAIREAAARQSSRRRGAATTAARALPSQHSLPRREAPAPRRTPPARSALQPLTPLYKLVAPCAPVSRVSPVRVAKNQQDYCLAVPARRSHSSPNGASQQGSQQRKRRQLEAPARPSSRLGSAEGTDAMDAEENPSPNGADAAVPPEMYAERGFSTLLLADEVLPDEEDNKSPGNLQGMERTEPPNGVPVQLGT